MKDQEYYVLWSIYQCKRLSVPCKWPMDHSAFSWMWLSPVVLLGPKKLRLDQQRKDDPSGQSCCSGLHVMYRD